MNRLNDINKRQKTPIDFLLAILTASASCILPQMWGCQRGILWRQTKTRGSSIQGLPTGTHNNSPNSHTYLFYNFPRRNGTVWKRRPHIASDIMMIKAYIYFPFRIRRTILLTHHQTWGTPTKVQLVLELFSETAIYFDEWRMCASSKLHTWRLFTERGRLSSLSVLELGLTKTPFKLEGRRGELFFIVCSVCVWFQCKITLWRRF